MKTHHKTAGHGGNKDVPPILDEVMASWDSDQACLWGNHRSHLVPVTKAGEFALLLAACGKRSVQCSTTWSKPDNDVGGTVTKEVSSCTQSTMANLEKRSERRLRGNLRPRCELF